MIRSVADMLKGFMDEESSKLNDYELRHGPTIGAMYEGLSVELLNKSIPSSLNLKIVEGFVNDGKDFLSGQIDCMLVQGEGENIPFTNSYKWHIKDVLAVFEVKKSLYSDDLIDSFEKLRQVSQSYSSYIFNGDHQDGKTINLSSAYKVFSEITGIMAPPYHEREQKLTKEQEMIYITLIIEKLMPVRITLGYNGFATEFALRDKLFNYLEKSLGQNSSGVSGFGINSFPQLIICGTNSLVKINGMPYSHSSSDGFWNFMCSSSDNPLIFMIELIWSKLESEFNINMPWGEDLDTEIMHAYLRAKPHHSDIQEGWEYEYIDIPQNILSEQKAPSEWEPIKVTETQFVVFNMLSDEANKISIDDINFQNFVKSKEDSVENFIKNMISTGYVALDGSILKLTTINLQTIITPDGEFRVGENNSGRVDAWLKKFLESEN